ncbi:MAG TPA: TerC/Alx family metal homeostasis membrane protein [Streptosporangiaceae bacterium]
MDVSLWAWVITLGALLALIAIDLVIVDLGPPREFSMRQAGFWVCLYVALAAVFGLGIALFVGGTYSGQFFAGYLTEYSLSIDNLFIFYVIMQRFAVPRVHQHKVLLIGIVLALLLRGVFIAAGAAAVARFEWVFFIFGGFLIWTASSLFREGQGEHGEEEFKENMLLRLSRRLLRTTDDYDGAKVLTRRPGRLHVTPLLIVMIAIGTTDLLFALDSIPAIFGLTKEPYLVFTSNAFALMGLRQLYFLLGGLVERLIYLSRGLSFILAFIGVKLVLEALHGYHVPWAPEIPIWLSLAVIAGAMAVTTAASLLKARRSPSGPAAAADAGPGEGARHDAAADDADADADADPDDDAYGADTPDRAGGETGRDAPRTARDHADQRR